MLLPAVSWLLVRAAAVAAAVSRAELTEGYQLDVQLILQLPGLLTQIWARNGETCWENTTWYKHILVIWKI